MVIGHIFVRMNNLNDLSNGWGVCAVCIPRESYYWLFDWIDHHVKAGASKVVIYDNTGSQGSARRSSMFSTGKLQQKGESKRGERYGELTAHLSDEQIQQDLRDLAKGYLDKVEIVAWQPRHPEKGYIVHGQVEAYVDFIRRYRGVLRWGAFLDLDEYLYCRPGLSIGSVIDQLESKYAKVSLVQLKSLRFECRWGDSGPKDITRMTGHAPIKHGNEKNFARLADVTHANIHWDWKLAPGCSRGMMHPSDFAFCHYNQKPEDLPEELVPLEPRKFLTSMADDEIKIRLLNPMLPKGREKVAPLPV